ncbi:MAG: DNA repair protein RadC [Nitrospirae bacterium]|nr:DNA repair protein RadC [Nitrospirota bacterium]
MEKAGINHWPEEERPRERLIKEGADRLSPAQLLAIVLRTGSEGKSALELAMEIIRHYGDLKALSGATVHELCAIKGVGVAKAAEIKAALEIGKRAVTQPLGKRRRVLSSKDVYDVSRHYIQYFHGLKKEVFRLLMLDGKNRIFADYTVSEGCLTSSIVHPREVYIQAIRNSAASVIFLHNHPSGDPSPSPEDIEITRRLVAAGELLGIKVLDHVIMGDGGYLSFADKGLL